jgi:hypothetical protein
VIPTYDPSFDACRVCGSPPPHTVERSDASGRFDVICLVCRTLLDCKPIGELDQHIEKLRGLIEK